MPVMDGWEFVAILRAQSSLSSVPVVVHTSAPEQAPPGATRVIQKPLKFERLLSVVREYSPSSNRPSGRLTPSVGALA